MNMECNSFPSRFKMNVDTVNFPNFYPNDNYQRQYKRKFERVYKFQHPIIGKWNLDRDTKISLLPTIESSGMAIKSRNLHLEPFYTRFNLNRLQEKVNYYWNQTRDSPYSTKEFPDFKTPLDFEHNRNILKPTILETSSSNLNINPEKIQKERKNSKDYFRTNTEEIVMTEKNYNYKDKLRRSKKVKWEDGYCDNSSLERYPNEESFTKSFENYIPSTIKPIYFENNFSTNKNEGYTEPKLIDYHTKYDYFEPFNSYSSKKLYPKSYKNLYFYEHPNLWSSKNWLYVEEDSKNYNPYHYDYDNRITRKYHSSNQKAYRNSDTQYNLVERVRNKKLQVCQPYSSKILDKKVKVESKRVGGEKSGIRLSRSENLLKKREDACTQVTESKHQSHQTVLSNSETKLQNQIDSTVVSRLLVGLSEKLKNSENSISSLKQKYILMERGTQYTLSDIKKKSRFSRLILPKKSKKFSENKKNFKSKSSHQNDLRNESTQYEEMRSSDQNFTSSSINSENEFCIKNKGNFCEIETTKKKRGLKSSHDEIIYGRRLGSNEVSKSLKGSQQSILNSDLPKKSKNLRPRLSKVITKHLPFFIDKENKNEGDKLKKDLIEVKKIKKTEGEKVQKQKRKRSKSLRVEGDGLKSKNESKCTKKSRSLSVCSINSGFFSPEEGYLEKYVVKLSNPEEELVLFDVKPKFCDYLNGKGVRETIVQKLKSGFKD